MSDNYDEILTEHSKLILNEILEREGCYFCGELIPTNYLISIGKFFTCSLCWKKFAIFVREWMEHDVFK